ncbi:hypothetical protein LNQ03_04885 [Klebsiella pneumoniae subsp. pneumoniae]|nr:hypothetical protein [Klebsiella pneumoniae subsp. pneumoniae]
MVSPASAPSPWQGRRKRRQNRPCRPTIRTVSCARATPG